MKEEFAYSGKELQLFRHAVNWKKYFSEKIRPYISGDVLEVGAGLGGNIPFLMNDSVTSWTCLEPDKNLSDKISVEERIQKINGTLKDIENSLRYNCIIYIDVLEHIENDAAEIQSASRFLKENGRIIILSPAYNYLMSDFDKEIGHYRRYHTSTLRAVMKTGMLMEEKIFYLESAGIILLLINKFITRKKYPSAANIKIWDRLVIPVSKITDAISGYLFGKTIIGIWKKR